MDPMLLEALLMDQRSNIERGYSTPSSNDTPALIVNHHPSMEEIQTPLLLRNEVEQLVGQKLIKALSDFKQLAVVPLSSYAQ